MLRGRLMFRELPIIGCVRSRTGLIVDITERLLDLGQRRRRDVVGRRLTDVWPQGASWLSLDRAALAARKPLVQLEYSPSVGWLRSTRLPQRGRVIWVAEDATAEVQLAALRAVQVSRLRPAPGSDAVVSLLLAGCAVRDICAALNVPADTVLAVLARNMPDS